MSNTYHYWKWSSGWLGSYEGLLLATGVSTNLCGSHLQSQIIRLWRWLPHRLSKRQSPTTFLLKTPTTQTIIIFQSRYVTPGCKPFSYLCENCNHVLPAWIASKFFRDSYSLCNRLFFVFVVFFSLRNHAKLVTRQKWNKTSGVISPRVKRRLQAFALRHDSFNWLQVYYWSKYFEVGFVALDLL